ncbi:histidine kinase [Actinomyces sp. oral taxon 414]|uniref:sensor histidine kinase n=1 Tax=Actinomyces sp. oral taxon 414 TaxID=712122 RepID=UPI0006AF8D07|nr:histidine kinase [Actinomyces sp. oral taxon 414]ALC99096.1 histidine kinase [Actinomyces sp. oral taxon 414]
MPALDALPRHSAFGRAITGTAALIVGVGLLIGVYPAPSPRIQMTMILAMTGLVAAALWLRRRDRRVYEWRLAQETAARAVAEDRLVIARELHDAVSGNLGAITVRCAVARRLETTPDGLRRALDDVEAASREATDGLRRMLAVLRDGRTPPAPGAVTASAPSAGAGAGLAGSLAEAIDAARRAGVGVEFDADAGAGVGAGADAGAGAEADAGVDTVLGATVPDGLTAPVSRAAARVVDEALVNTARHAGPTRARVALLKEPGWLRVRVVDDGPAPGWTPRPGAGQGLRGLHERVAALGGSLAAGPRGDAPGFAVEAVLPREPGPRASGSIPGSARD